MDNQCGSSPQGPASSVVLWGGHRKLGDGTELEGPQVPGDLPSEGHSYSRSPNLGPVSLYVSASPYRTTTCGLSTHTQTSKSASHHLHFLKLQAKSISLSFPSSLSYCFGSIFSKLIYSYLYNNADRHSGAGVSVPHRPETPISSVFLFLCP